MKQKASTKIPVKDFSWYAKKINIEDSFR